MLIFEGDNNRAMENVQGDDDKYKICVDNKWQFTYRTSIGHIFKQITSIELKF